MTAWTLSDLKYSKSVYLQNGNCIICNTKITNAKEYGEHDGFIYRCKECNEKTLIFLGNSFLLNEEKCSLVSGLYNEMHKNNILRYTDEYYTL